jgi:hypothetical protein
MSKSTWTGAVKSDWNDADNWSPAGVPGVNSDVVIAGGAPAASASIGTVNSITDFLRPLAYPNLKSAETRLNKLTWLSVIESVAPSPITTSDPTCDIALVSAA